MQLIQLKHLHIHDFKHPCVMVLKIRKMITRLNLNFELKDMTYLFSLLTSESPAKELTQVLCYYINDTSHIQIIRAMSGVKCHFERIVFSGERILFEALPESYLEIYSSLIDGTRSSKIDCKLLRVDEKPDRTKALS